MNLLEYSHDFILFYFESSDLFRMYTNMFWVCLKICSLLYCRTLPHRWAAAQCRAHSRTTAHCRTHCHTLPHCGTQPCALPHSAAHTATHCRTHCQTPPHCRTQPCALPHSAAHCSLIRIPDSYTPHAAQRRQSHTATNMNWNTCIWMCVNLCKFMRICVN
jgi:hypothetical protein